MSVKVTISIFPAALDHPGDGVTTTESAFQFQECDVIIQQFQKKHCLKSREFRQLGTLETRHRVQARMDQIVAASLISGDLSLKKYSEFISAEMVIPGV